MLISSFLYSDPFLNTLLTILSDALEFLRLSPFEFFIVVSYRVSP